MPKKKVTEAVDEVEQTSVITEPTPAPMPRRQSSEDLLELNDLERGVTREDSEDAKWGYLAGAVRRQQILTGIVSSGIMNIENGVPSCAIDFEGLRILIPVREMVLTEWSSDEPVPRAVRIKLGRMLGATIDFIPAAVDIKNRAAVGSRKAAMLQRQNRYYATGRVKPGILMACRVLAVGNNTMTVEACGVDTEIYARNVSWEWFSDIADLHSTGDLVVARVLDVSHNEGQDTYSVSLSIKEASDNPDRAALEKIVPNSNYFGVVTGVKDRVFFVRLQAGVNAKTKLYRSIEMPSRLDTVSFRVTGVDEENGSSTVATGYITTAEYKGTVVSEGISSILYTVTYLGTEITPMEEWPSFGGAIVVIPVIGGIILFVALLLLATMLRKNTTVYKATGKGNEYEKCGRLRLKTKDPELRVDRLKEIPEGMIAVEIDEAVAKKLFGQTITIHCYDNTVEHTVGTVNGQYWFKVDIGTQVGESDSKEDPV